MAEKSTKLVTYQVDYFCDECGEPMKWNGICLTEYPAQYPPQYPHLCKNGHGKTFLCSYPATAYEFERGLTQRAADGYRRLYSWLRGAIRRR